MSSKYWALLLILFASVAGGYYWLMQKKQARVEVEMRAWQENAADYLTFEYENVSASWWSDAIYLHQVQVTYPVLMSADQIKVSATPKDDLLQKLHLAVENVNFTLPTVTNEQSWEGDFEFDYQYDADLKQVELHLAPDFPQQFSSDVRLLLLNVTPNINIIFDYADVMLVNLELEIKNDGFFTDYAAWQKLFVTDMQRDAVNHFINDQSTLKIYFAPEYPLPFYRIMDNPKLFWQHPAVEVTN